MKVLLDTQTTLWFLEGNTRLSARARELIENPNSEVWVSAATAWEIATKDRLGKLPLAPYLRADLAAYVDSQGFSKLAVTFEHALAAGSLPAHHRDPFDRLLIAQAKLESMTVVTNDAAFAMYGARVIW